MIFCCCARRIGGMFSLVERSDGSPIIIAGPCWPCCFFITLPLIAGIAGLVTYYVVFNQDLGLPIWVAIVYIPLVVITLISLSCVSCRDPGLLERVTDEEAGHGGWFWNEQVGSFRPTGAMYCRECKVNFSIQTNALSIFIHAFNPSHLLCYDLYFSGSY